MNEEQLRPTVREFLTLYEREKTLPLHIQSGLLGQRVVLEFVLQMLAHPNTAGKLIREEWPKAKAEFAESDYTKTGEKA